MANSDIPANDRGDEQAPSELNVSDRRTPPSSVKNTESGNKRKRESVAANVNINEETKSATVADTGVETGDVKEVKMNDAASADHSVNDVEMQDAEAAYDKPDVDEHDTDDDRTRSETVDNKDDNETGWNLNADEGRKEESTSEKQRSGEHVLGEVAALLKQVKESETKGKLQVEVKVKKVDDGDAKENGEVNKEEVKEDDPTRGSG